jgi:hypothetical protein
LPGKLAAYPFWHEQSKGKQDSANIHEIAASLTVGGSSSCVARLELEPVEEMSAASWRTGDYQYFSG